MRSSYQVLLAATIFFTSCGTSVREDIYLNADGTGHYEITSQISEGAYLSAAKKGKLQNAEDSALVKQEITNYLKDIADTVAGGMGNEPKFSNDPKLKALLNRAQYFIKKRPEIPEVTYGMTFDFKNAAEIATLCDVAGELDKNGGGHPRTTQLNIAAFESSPTLFQKINRLPKILADTLDGIDIPMFFLGDKTTEYVTTLHSKRKIAKVDCQYKHSFTDSTATFVIAYELDTSATFDRSFKVHFSSNKK
jgi:hypothetical protein